MKIEGLADSRCCGCAACANACAVGAISMIENQEGFLYPVINREMCVGCGACDRVCPRLEEYPMAYAAMCNSSRKKYQPACTKLRFHITKNPSNSALNILGALQLF